MGSIPIAHSRNPVDAVGFTGFPLWVLRKVLSPLSTVEAMELLLSRLTKPSATANFWLPCRHRPEQPARPKRDR